MKYQKIPALGLLACLSYAIIIGALSAPSEEPINIPNFLLGTGLFVFGIWCAVLLLISKTEAKTDKINKSKMFIDLTDFSRVRNFKEALGFYLAYLLLAVLFIFLLGMISGVVGLNFDNDGLVVGALIILVEVLVLSVLILKAKNLYKNFTYILLSLLSCLLAILGGGLLGLIIPAYFTTLKVFEKNKGKIESLTKQEL
jgi:hypothetical protein